jgi:hypothetical protein
MKAKQKYVSNEDIMDEYYSRYITNEIIRYLRDQQKMIGCTILFPLQSLDWDDIVKDLERRNI